MYCLIFSESDPSIKILELTFHDFKINSFLDRHFYSRSLFFSSTNILQDSLACVLMMWTQHADEFINPFVADSTLMCVWRVEHAHYIHVVLRKHKKKKNMNKNMFIFKITIINIRFTNIQNLWQWKGNCYL